MNNEKIVVPILKCISDFEIQTVEKDRKREDGKNKNIINSKPERITGKCITIEEIIHQWTFNEREKLMEELKWIIRISFPFMAEEEVLEYVNDYATPAGNNFHRQAIFLRNGKGKLIATGLFDQGPIQYKGKPFIGIYSILRAVIPEYQGFGITKSINLKLLNEIKPDILFANVYQSSALHAWVGLYQRDLIAGFEVFPRFDKINGEVQRITYPYKDLDFAINAFKQTYICLVKNDEILMEELNNLTVNMVRKNTHENFYPFNPWEKFGREDLLAKSLGVTDRDGILVIFRKTMPY